MKKYWFNNTVASGIDLQIVFHIKPIYLVPNYFVSKFLAQFLILQNRLHYKFGVSTKN